MVKKQRNVLVAASMSVVAALLLASAEALPGVRVSLTMAGMNYVKSVVMPQLEAQITQTQIPDVEAKIKISKLLGSATVGMNGIKVTTFHAGNVDISLTPSSTVTGRVAGVSTVIEFGWHYKYKGVHDSGRARAEVSGASTGVSIKLASDAAGRPAGTITASDFNIGSLNVKVTTGSITKVIYNLLLKWCRGIITNAVNKNVRDQLARSGNAMLAAALATLPVKVDLGSNMTLSYALAENPLVTTDAGGRLILGPVAETYATRDGPGKSPYKPSAMPTSGALGKTLELFVNEFALNTFAYAYVRAGNTHWHVGKDNASGSAAKYFESVYYSVIAPGLLTKYGAAAEMRIEMDVAAAPKITFQPDGFALDASMETVFQAKNAQGAFETAFSLAVALHCKGAVAVSGTQLKGSLEAAGISITLAQSNVGDVAVKLLDEVVSFAAGVALKVVNVYLDRGIPLPVVSGVALVNPAIVWGSNYVSIQTDFTYTPK